MVDSKWWVVNFFYMPLFDMRFSLCKMHVYGVLNGIIKRTLSFSSPLDIAWVKNTLSSIILKNKIRQNLWAIRKKITKISKKSFLLKNSKQLWKTSFERFEGLLNLCQKITMFSILGVPIFFFFFFNHSLGN